MARSEYSVEQVEMMFRRQKVRTKRELLSEIGCGSMTLYRLLSRAGYFSSYNKNGRFYTLSHIPRFDSLGLWAYRGIRFSQYGTLTETIVALVRGSATGMAAREVTELLGVNVAPSLSRLSRQRRVGCERYGRNRRYFDIDHRRAGSQKEAWRTAQRSSLPDLSVVVAVLVELIVGTHDSLTGLRGALERKMVRVTDDELNAVFDHYGIKKNVSTGSDPVAPPTPA